MRCTNMMRIIMGQTRCLPLTSHSGAELVPADSFCPSHVRFFGATFIVPRLQCGAAGHKPQASTLLAHHRSLQHYHGEVTRIARDHGICWMAILLFRPLRRPYVIPRRARGIGRGKTSKTHLTLRNKAEPRQARR